jgi:hypothetical protein
MADPTLPDYADAAAVDAALDLAVTSLQATDIGTSVQGYDADTVKADTTTTFGKAVHETAVDLGSGTTIDVSLGGLFYKTISGATTFTVSNVPSSGAVASFILSLTNGGSATITWWSGMRWPGGVAPTLTASGMDVLGFYTRDGGTTWTGLVLGRDVKAPA